MFDKIWKLYLKYREVILYLIFGGLTTLINIISYTVCAHVFYMDTVEGTSVAWLLSVIFAYATNKIFVFQSRTSTFAMLTKECISFMGCRLATGVMDVVIMYLSVDILHFNDVFMKIVSNVFVVILNYVFSKLFIFSKKQV